MLLSLPPRPSKILATNRSEPVYRCDTAPSATAALACASSSKMPQPAETCWLDC